ncbi:hypothetical protein ACU80K_14490 [Bacillus mycoides]
METFVIRHQIRGECKHYITPFKAPYKHLPSNKSLRKRKNKNKNNYKNKKARKNKTGVVVVKKFEIRMPKPLPHSYIYIEGLEFSYLLVKSGRETDGGVP